MCFYRDTQAVLAKNNLQQFLLKKVQKTNKKAYTHQVKEENTEKAPQKPLQISAGLFQDLLKLSTGEEIIMNQSDTMTTDDRGGSNYEMIPENKAREQDINLKVEFGAEERYIQEMPIIPSHFDELLMMIEFTNQKIEYFRNSQTVIQKQVEDLAKQAKNEDIEECPFERLNKMSQSEKQTVKPVKNPSAAEMLAVFTKGRTDFPYAIRLSSKLPSPIMRERNIKISVELVKISDGSIVENHGSMLLQMSVHTWELPSTPILRNRAGNKVLQGEDECELKNGQGCFEKLQMNEVTSKFINGCVGVLVVPKRPVNFGTSLESLHQKRLIKIQDIKPLLIEKVVIRSKKKIVPTQ